MVDNATPPTLGWSFPGWPFWLIAVVGAPLLAIGAFVLAGIVVPGFGMDGNDVLVVLVLLSAAMGAVLTWALRQVRAAPLAVRCLWTVTAALAAAVSVLPWAFLFLFAALALFCDGCLS